MPSRTSIVFTSGRFASSCLAHAQSSHWRTILHSEREKRELITKMACKRKIPAIIESDDDDTPSQGIKRSKLLLTILEVAGRSSSRGEEKKDDTRNAGGADELPHSRQEELQTGFNAATTTAPSSRTRTESISAQAPTMPITAAARRTNS